MSEVGYAVDVEGEEDVYGSGGGFAARGRISATRAGWEEYDGGVVVASKPREAKIEEEWDGMDMEMEM